jgi:hypothetical protein
MPQWKGRLGIGVIKWSFMDMVKTYSAVLVACVMLGPGSWGGESLLELSIILWIRIVRILTACDHLRMGSQSWASRNCYYFGFSVEV